MRDFKDRNAEQVAWIPRIDQSNRKLAIFVHGFFGHYLETWQGFPERFNTAECDTKPVFRDWDYFFLGYDTKRQKTYLDVSNLIVRRWKDAIGGGGMFAEHGPYEKVALLGHSLGTLGIRQALCAVSLYHPSELLPTLHKVGYYGTPQAGSYLAKFASLAVDIAEALKPTSQQLRMLFEWVKTGFILRPWPLVRTMHGQDDQVVLAQTPWLVTWHGDDQPTISTRDHTGMCKPQGWNDEAMDFARDVLS